MEDNKHQKLFDKATDIGIEINKHLMTLSTGALGGFFFLFLNPKVTLDEIEKILLTVAIFVFGATIFAALTVWQTQATRYFMTGIALDPKHKEEKSKNLAKKRSIDARLKFLKRAVRWLFIFGIFCSIAFILHYVYA